jgi:60 kDa SS-A/Ro ribonucleoprotein
MRQVAHVRAMLKEEGMMANKSLFASFKNRLARADAVNEAGGRAYKRTAKAALAQLAATGCFNNTFYVRGSDQLMTLKQLIAEVDDARFLAKLAVYSRQHAMMKDMPAALLVAVWVRDPELAHAIFDRVVGNGRMLRNVFQMVRSGQFGRRGLSSSMQRAFQRWFNETPVRGLLAASIGNDPSLRDVLRMARPTPSSNDRRALFGYLTDRTVDKWAPATASDLPSQVVALRAFRAAKSAEDQVQILRDLSVRWDLLADAAKGPKVWRAIARQMGPQALRMNLNTLLRHGVFGEHN